ncbi:ribonuclease HI family protein [Aquabacterium lacunae]|nr:ribonuclease HI family protein [Aquabacterium lacunae]
MWHLAVDGSALPNPGRMGIGVVLRQPGGRVHGQWGREVGHGCNNEAELRALTFGLRLAADFGARALVVQTDSTVLLELLAPAAGHAPKQIARLQSVADEARLALARLPAVQWLWVPRHRNREADALARAALGMPARDEASLAKVKGRVKDRSRKKR